MWASFSSLARRPPSRTLCLLFLLLLCFGHIHQGTLGPDGIRYAHISKTILNRQDWLNLWDEFKDAPYVNKPPVLFWLTAGVFDFAGFSTFAARFLPVTLVFCAMLGLYRLTRHHYDELTAFLAVGLFALNAEFFRAVLDLNFEGFVLCGSVLTLGALIDFAKSKRASWQLAFGLAFFLASKPPFVIFPLCVLCLLLLQNRRLITPGLILAVSIPLTAYGAFIIHQNPTLRSVSLQNQLQQPFILEHSWSNNFVKWMRIFLLYYAPFSWVGIWTATRLWKHRDYGAVRRVLLIWLLPILPIVFLIDVRGPYLLLPLLSLAILSAIELRAVLEKHCGLGTARNGLGVVVRCGVLILALPLLGVHFHGSDEFLRFFMARPQYLHTSTTTATEQPVPLCVDGNDGTPSMPRLKRLDMLLELHTGTRQPVYTSVTLPLDSSAAERPIIANGSCRTNLEKKGIKLKMVDQSRGVAAIRLDSIPAQAAAKQKSYPEFKEEFGPFD